MDNCDSFAEGCNKEAEKAKGEYLAFIKPGVVLSDTWLKNIEVALDGEHRAACGPAIYGRVKMALLVFIP